MERRKFLAGGGLFVIGTAAGCTGHFQPASTQSEAKRVHFKEIESEYTITIRNELTEPTTAAVVVTAANETTEEETVSVEPGNETPVRGLFTVGQEPYTVSVSAGEIETKQTLRPSESPYDKFLYTIMSDKINFKKGYKPTSDIAISNNSNESVDVRVAVNDSSNSSNIYDISTISSNTTQGFRDVLAVGRKYDITVQANGMTRTITHTNSDTTTISINVERDDLRLFSTEM